MIGNLWTSLFGIGRKTIIEKPNDNEVQVDLDSAPQEPFCQLPLEEEVLVLAQEFGGLASGMKLEIGLHRILQICPRRRKKADAYLGLKKKLRDDYDVELVITSKNSKTQNE